MKKHPLPEKTRENIRTALRRDTREGFLHELAGKGIVPVLWENGAGVIYGVTYIDHNIRAVFKDRRSARSSPLRLSTGNTARSRPSPTGRLPDRNRP